MDPNLHLLPDTVEIKRVRTSSVKRGSGCMRFSDSSEVMRWRPGPPARTNRGFWTYLVVIGAGVGVGARGGCPRGREERLRG